MRWLECAAALGLGVLAASCRFVPTAEVKKLGDTSLMNGQASFDPAKKVAAVWATKVISISSRGPVRSPRCATSPPNR